MLVLGAPEELEALVGLFGKLYVSTFDYCAVYSHPTPTYRTAATNVSESIESAKCDSFFADVFMFEQQKAEISR